LHSPERIQTWGMEFCGEGGEKQGEKERGEEESKDLSVAVVEA